MSRSGYTASRLYRGTDASMRLGLRLATPAWLCVGAASILSVVGISAIGTTRPELATRQAMFLVVGLVCAAIVTIVPPRALRVLCWAVLALALALLVFVLLPFVPKSLVTPRNGSRAWINMGAADFQPSELAKIAFILCLSQWYALQGSPRTLAALLVPGSIAGLLVGLIVLEPDLGSALLFAPTFAGITIVAGVRMRFVWLALLAAAVIAPAGYFLALKPYQRGRAPRANTELHDMVFAVVACRFGLVGATLVLLSYAMYAFGAFSMAMLARDGYSKLVAVGIGSLVFAQMTVNIGMTIGLLPITGVTLPFISYGGSSLLSCWVLTGLLLGIGIRPPTGGEKDPFDG